MTRTLFLDSETFSETPITHGTHRYAEGAEVMIVTYAWDDEPVQTVEFPARGDVQELLDEADVIVGHNIGNFDSVVFRHALNVETDLSKTFDTMACALSHSLPGSLGKLCEVLKVDADDAKTDGKQLIQLFCKPRPKTSKLRRATKETHPDEWRQFLAYAGRDITSLRALYRKLPRWNYDIGKPEHRVWQLDQRINSRGVRIDLGLARSAIVACADAKDILAARVNEMTDGEVQAATQRDLMLKHLLERYGVTLPDFQKGTLERRLEDPDLPEPVRELLAIRLQASSTSVAKYQRLADATSSDERLRGTLQYCGAMRTGRWAGRIFQPQNLPRTPDSYTADVQEAEIAIIKGGMADLVLPNIIEASSYAIRGSMIAGEGKELVVADLSNIEGRVLAWLAGETWKIEAFEAYDRGEGPDLYKVTAGRILNKTPEAVTKDERQTTGKVPELACGYQGAAGAFDAMAKIYNLQLSPKEVLKIVLQWRAANAKIVQFWYDMEEAARMAVAAPGEVFPVGRVALRRDGAWLKMKLPSGRFLCYPSPRIEGVPCPCMKCKGDGKILYQDETVETCDKCKGKGTVPRNQITYAGINQYSRKWERLKTYGGKLVENCVQATARDVIVEGLLTADARGFAPLLSVHDEIITEREPAEDNLEDLVGFMTGRGNAAIPWCDGLPLAADGFTARRYRK